MKKSIVIGMALAAILGLSACGSSAEIVSNPPTSSVAAPQASQAPAPTTAPEAKVAKFGEAFVWSDGMSVKVTPIGAGMATAYAAGAEATNGQIYVFEVEIFNGTDANFDPVLFVSHTNYGSAGTPAQRVFDADQGVSGSFQGVILPGKRQTMKMALAIPADQLGDVVMSVSPGFQYTDEVFSGDLK